MPNTDSAKKRLRQTAKRTAHNRAVRSSVRTSIRKVREAVSAGDIEKAETSFKEASRKLDLAGSKKIYHKNTVGRLKSRLSSSIKKAKSEDS